MEEKKTNYSTIIIMIVLVVVSFIAGLSVGRMQPKQKPEKVEAEPKKQIEFELMDELADIAQLNRDLTAEYLAPLLTHDGIISDMDAKTKTRIIYIYAVLQHKTKTVSGSEFSSCEAGSGYCEGIEISTFKEISALYGISNFAPTDCYTYKNMYLFYYGGAADTYEEARQNITAEYQENDDILMTDVITYVPINNINTTQKLTKEFLFKKNDKGYYLYSVNTK